MLKKSAGKIDEAEVCMYVYIYVYIYIYMHVYTCNWLARLMRLRYVCIYVRMYVLGGYVMTSAGQD
jgi:hypothetical protein